MDSAMFPPGRTSVYLTDPHSAHFPQAQNDAARSMPMYCTIIDIRGDYAYVKYLDTGVVSEVAIALLPFGVDTGDRLKFENYEFSPA